MKIVNIKKFIRSMTIVLLIIVGLSLIISKSAYSKGEKQYKTIHVSKGDTLWNIAKNNQECNDYYKGKDIRYIVNDIAQINNIEKSNLKIGQELIIPVI
ncbi:MAG: LysM peptidoglycan-binding domain-containing protein [Clostridia bacterium]